MIDWNTLVTTHSAAVFGIAWRILGQAEDAEDVVQEVFAEAHRTSNGKEVACWSALLRRMATCRALDVLRRRRSTTPLETIPQAAAPETTEAVVAVRELEARLRAAIPKLSDREAEVFCLRCFENLSNPEIAETLSMSATAVSTALGKARAKLEKWLA